MKLKISNFTVLIILVFNCFNNKLYSQLKVGDNPQSINPDAMLEIESGNKGLLLPRISLKSTSTPFPMRNFTSGMVVYNTSTSIDVIPGLYYCDGTKWVKANTSLSNLSSETNNNNYWSLTGNNGVTPNYFLGTINNAALIVRTNNLERFRITEKGWVGVGTSTPKATLEVKGQLVVDSLNLGNLVTDKILVANPSDGRVKYIPTPSFNYVVQNYNETVSYNGKTIFTTPATITDTNKLFLYRNGVLISFTVNSSNTIVSELPCKQGDQIRIIQLL